MLSPVSTKYCKMLRIKELCCHRPEVALHPKTQRPCRHSEPWAERWPRVSLNQKCPSRMPHPLDIFIHFQSFSYIFHILPYCFIMFHCFSVFHTFLTFNIFQLDLNWKDSKSCRNSETPRIWRPLVPAAAPTLVVASPGHPRPAWSLGFRLRHVSDLNTFKILQTCWCLTVYACLCLHPQNQNQITKYTILVDSEHQYMM